MALELAQRGHSVVVLEVGTSIDRSAIPTSRPDWELHRHDAFPVDAERDRVEYATTSDPSFRLSRFKGLGGSTMHYEGCCMRTHPGDLVRQSQAGVGADWPLRYADLVPHYERVEAMLGVSGTRDNPFEPARNPYPNPPLPMSCAVKHIKEAADGLGLHTAHSPMAILSRPAAHGAACNFCGGCWWGCARGAISNMSRTYLPLAEKHGAKIETGAMATRVLLKAGGKVVRGVEYRDASGADRLQEAKCVAICGNAVETPRLLLMSSSGEHPHGLANSSGLVGRHLSCNTVVTVAALLDTRVNAYMGPNINGMIQDFYDHDERRGYAGGYTVALRNAQSGPLSFLESWRERDDLYGESLYEFMEDGFGRSVELAAYGEHFADREDHVDLDPEVKDRFGLPVPRIEIRLHENERRMLRHMEETVRKILEAAGGRQLTLREEPGFVGTHVVGTCRMGENSKQSVTDPYGETHDVSKLFIADGSLFPTSTPANPSLTIQALATRVAARMARKASGSA